MHTPTAPRNRFLVGLVAVILVTSIAIPSVVAAQSTTAGVTPGATTTGTTVVDGTTAGTQTVVANETESSDVSLAVDATAAGAVTNHTLDVPLGEASAGNLTGISVNYTAANASTRPVLDDVENLTVEVGDQAVSVPENATVAATNFRRVDYTFALNESLQPEAGDQLHLVYPIQNPSEAGEYTVSVVINSEGDDPVSMTTNLTITENQSATTGGTETTVSAATTQGTEGGTTAASSSDTGTSGGETTTGGNGPGFTVVAGLICVLATALFALGRE